MKAVVSKVFLNLKVRDLDGHIWELAWFDTSAL